MHNTNWISLTNPLMTVLAILLLSGPVLAQSMGTMHPGMNPTPGPMMGYPHSYQGAGPGGYGMGGYGMKGYGMGGYGMGGFGMGGYGMGEYGMGGYGSNFSYFYGLNLTSQQRLKIRDLRQKQRDTNLPLITKLMDESDKLDDLYSQATPSPKDVGKVYESIFSIRRKLIENQVQLHNNIYALLTDEQKKQLKNEESYYGHHGMMY